MSLPDVPAGSVGGARLGAPDGLFVLRPASGGRLAVDIGPNPGAISINAMVVQPDGKALLAGGTGRALAIQRINTDGSLDATFSNGSTDLVWDGGDGIASYAPNNSGGFSRSAVALQADGKIVAVGSSRFNFADNADFALARVNPDGTLDATFGTGGIVTTNLAGSDAAYAVAVQSDGKIVAAGGSNQAANNLDTTAAVVRYIINGTLDTTFGTAGKLNLNLGTTGDTFGAIALQADGKIVLGGSGRRGHPDDDPAAPAGLQRARLHRGHGGHHLH